MSVIHRDIYVTWRQRIQPIDIVRGCQVGIELQLMDYEIPTGASAKAYARGRYAPNTYVSNCAVSGKTVSFTPPDGFFIPGPNRLQIEINGVIIPFSIDVECESRISDAGDPATPEQVKPLIERAETAAEKADSAQKAVEALQAELENNYPGVPAVKAQVDELKKDLSAFKDGFKNSNLFHDAELYKENYYVNIYEGHINPSPDNSFNSYILKVDGTMKYTSNTSMRFALPLASDKYTSTSSELLANINTIDMSLYPGTEWLAFSFNKDVYPISEFAISEGETAEESFILPQWYNADIGPIKAAMSEIRNAVDKIHQPLSKGIVSMDGAFGESGNFILLKNARTNLRKGIRMIFEATVASGTDFEIGFSISEAALTESHNIISVTDTNLIYNETYPHGLTVSGRVQVIFEYLADATANITLLCNGNTFKQSVAFVMSSVAVPYAKSNGLISSDCKLTFICTDIRKKIWMFGDSYFAYAPDRWPYYLEEYGYAKNVLLDGWPGMGSQNARVSFAKLLNLGTPAYAVWCNGMNDGTDISDAQPNADWEREKNIFLSLCNAYGVTPIFATIPNVPNINHKGKNAWIKSSGYRYIDMCHAVGADVDSNWYSNMLASDKIHPTETGAGALFAQVLLDLPEIMYDNL